MTFRRVAALAALVAACGGKKPSEVPVGVSDPRAWLRRPKAKDDRPLTGHVVAAIGGGTIGPFFARRGSGDAATGLVAWVTAAEGSGRRILVVPLYANGQPRDGERTAAIVPTDTTMLVVRPMRGPSPGFVVAWTSLTDRGESLWAAVVGDDGAPRGKAIELARTTDDVVWVDVVPTDAGAVCVWAEETRTGDANLTAAAIGGDAKVRGTPVRVARGAAGWHVLETAGGVGVSILLSAPDGKPRGDRTGTLSFQRLDAVARLDGPPIAITTTPSVSGDVEVAAADRRIVFAWTDRTTGEPSPLGTSLDEKGHAGPPHRLVTARGGAALLGLASGPSGTAVAFEAPVRRKGERRSVHVGRVTEELSFATAPTSFEVVGRAPPELAPTATGFAMLAALRDCEPGTAACEDTPTIATLVRFDHAMKVVQREPFTFGADPAALGWGLTCDGDACFALGASGGAPSRIRTAFVRPRNNVVAPRVEPLPEDAPRVDRSLVVARGESVVDLASSELGDGAVLATLTAKGEGAATRRLGSEAKTQPLVLSTRMVGPGASEVEPIVLSSRALAVGGVSIAAAGKAEDGGAVAWVARDNGGAQVHVTRVDKRGKRTSDVRLTSGKGDAGDVSIVWANDGWVVAWVDGRHGNGEIYATKVDVSLRRVVPEQRITDAPGDASDLVGLWSGDRVWLAWADPRESPRDGMADVFVASIRARDAKPAGEEIRVAATAAHSRTPALVASKDGGIQVAWIEEAPLGHRTPSSSGFGAMWATLDAQGKLLGAPEHVPLSGEGAATSVALEAAGGKTRAVVARSTPDALWLDAADLTVESPRAFPLVRLDGPPSLDVALVLRDDSLFFNDDGPSPSDKRARWVHIAWEPKDGGRGG